MSARKLLSQTIDVVEVAVGLVLVLLVEFRIIESFVVELLRILVLDWTSRFGMLERSC